MSNREARPAILRKNLDASVNTQASPFIPAADLARAIEPIRDMVAKDGVPDEWIVALEEFDRRLSRTWDFIGHIQEHFCPDDDPDWIDAVKKKALDEARSR